MMTTSCSSSSRIAGMRSFILLALIFIVTTSSTLVASAAEEGSSIVNTEAEEIISNEAQVGFDAISFKQSDSKSESVKGKRPKVTTDLRHLGDFENTRNHGKKGKGKGSSVGSCQDSLERFQIKDLGRALRSCEWASTKPYRCNNFKEVRENCPVTCDLCPQPSTAPSPMPSMDPSGKPTVTPSEKPSDAPSTSPTDMPSEHPTAKPSASPSEAPTAMPSEYPTEKPSASPSEAPSSNPSENPSQEPSHIPSSTPSISCKDSPNWRMPNDSIWKTSKFAHKTCDELAMYVNEENSKSLCDFLSQGIHSDICANDACCFCGGGSYADDDSMCTDLVFSTMSASNLNCSFVESSPDPNKFCQDFGDESFSSDGITINEACCICGGGKKCSGGNCLHYINKLVGSDTSRRVQDTMTAAETTNATESGGRKLFEADGDFPPQFIHPDLIDVPTPEAKIEYTYRKGAGLSPGVPNLEFLGLGYNAITGNPRGGLKVELDPGFSNRVYRLVQSQKQLNMDTSLMVPEGTELKYTSSCRYDSSSVEIQTDADLRSSMSGEVGFSAEAGFDSSVGVDLLISKYSSSISTKYAFSKSVKFQASREDSISRDSVSFEAKAICSEYEAAFSPFAQKEFDPLFLDALNCLPVPYDRSSKVDQEAYKKFIEAYGTHYIRQVVLGGKMIHSESMTSMDYASLVSLSVDVAGTLDFSMAAGIGSTAEVKAKHVKAAANVVKLAGPKGAAIGTAVNTVMEAADLDDNEVLFGMDAKAKSSYSLSMYASSQIQAEAALKISQKKTRHSLVYVGGLPSPDWDEWAESVKERPMPITYELGSILEGMTYDQAKAYIEALEHLYGIDLDAESTSTIPSNFHFGVFDGSGEPVGVYGYNPNTDYRVIMAVLHEYEDVPADENSPDSKFFKKVFEKVKKKFTPAWKKVTDSVTKIFKPPTPAPPPTPPAPNVTIPPIAPTESPGSVTIQVYDRAVELVKYGARWQGMTNKTTPMFATRIHRSPGENLREESGPYFMGDKLDYQQHIPFAFCEDKHILCNLAETRYTFIDEPDHGFSFLVIDESSNEDQNHLATGVVSHENVILNNGGSNDFYVSKKFDDYGDFFEVTLTDEMDIEDDQTPTVIVFPDVHDADYPDNVREIALYVERPATSKQFNVRASDVDTDPDHTHVGFSLLALSPKMNNPSIKHGSITLTQGSSLHGLDEPFFNISDPILNKKVQVFNFYKEKSWFVGFGTGKFFKIDSDPEYNFVDDVNYFEGGVKIPFTQPFEDTPAVIVTPMFVDGESDCRRKRHYQHQSGRAASSESCTTTIFFEGIIQCQVETITTKYAFVKCACIEEVVKIKYNSKYTERNTTCYRDDSVPKFANVDEFTKDGFEGELTKVSIKAVAFNIVAVGPTS